ncbi:MAG: DUF427 domain-containing protein [Streptosporangiales bacterium]|nr:DUF427 domain-containing protein [Streptosporangiales bacterium]
MTDALKTETGQKRVRAYLGGQLVADTRRPVLVWEHPYYPAYYLPTGDIHAELTPTGAVDRTDERGEAAVCDVVVGAHTASAAALRYGDGADDAVRGLVRLDWHAMDQWFEEDEPVAVHPRDPYKRIDVLASSRHVVVQVDGVVVAESRQPRILFETSLLPRHYLPLTDVRMDLLRPSDHRTHCPYKGTAHYWHVAVGDQLHENVVWTYPAPLPESQKITGLACFYDERVDVTLDGEPRPRPHTPFS